MQLEQPDCASWNIWEGLEIEGYTDLDKKTLFIRSATETEIVRLVSNYERVWFCDEYFDLNNNPYNTTDIYYMYDAPINEAWWKKLKSKNSNICIGIKYENYFSLIKFVKENFQIYIQLNKLHLKEGDHIKVGSLFYEESFMIGSGKRSNPDLYKQDIKID